MKKIHYIYLALVLIAYMGIYQGRIALWQDNSTTPDVIFPYRVDLLPVKDQQMLKDRIPITSQEELNRLIEDYLS